MKLNRWILPLLLLLTAVVYATLLNAPRLTWDDDSNIFNNPYYHAGWWATFWQSPYFGLYVPVTSFVWQVLFNVGGGAEWPYRVLNLTLHLANVALVFRLLRGLGRRWGMEDVAPAAIGTALFALHPLQVQPVAWISGGRDLLSAFFALTAIALYYRGRDWRTLLPATLLFALSLLSKPNDVLLPAALLILDLLLRPRDVKVLAPWLAGWLLLGLVPIEMTWDAQADHLVHVEWALRPWVMLDAFAFYWRKILLPWPLSGNYARTPDTVLANPRTLLPALLFLFAAGGLLAWGWRRERRVFILLAWITLLIPVSGLVSFGYQKISTVADHYNYLPMVAVSALVLLLVHGLRRWRRPTMAVSVGVLALFYALTWWRVGVWTSDENFFRDMAETAPTSYSTAIGMSIVMCQDRLEYDEGVRWTEVALAARPRDIMALANQAYCFLHAKNYFRVTELEFYLDQMNLRDLEQKQPTAYSSLLASIGTAEIEMKQFEDGYQYLCEAYRVKPAEPNHARNLEIASDILRAQGLTAECEAGESPAGPIEQLLEDN